MERSMDNKPISEEPSYKHGPHSSVLVTEVFCQNFDYSGFLKILASTYSELQFNCHDLNDSSSDDECIQLYEILPFSMFQHVMVNHLNLQILKIAWSNGHRDFPDPRYCELPRGSLPKPIADYISHVSNTVSPNGITLKLNLPKIAVPQGPIGDIPSGTFGVIDERTHNVYECYISPLVTANRLIASIKNTPDYEPLPSAIFPSGLVPTENLLGYGEIDRRPSLWRPELSDLEFPNDDSIEGRLKISNTLCRHVYSAMWRISNEMKIGHEIIPKSVYSNLCFVEIGRVDVAAYSHDNFSSATGNQAVFESMHRHRVAKEERVAEGSCYTATDGSTPPGWSATCNSNFEMDGEFAPVFHTDCPELRFKRYVFFCNPSLHYNILRKYFIKNT